MQTMLKVVLILGVAVWIFLMWERAQPDPRAVEDTIVRYNEYGEQIDNAEADDRCTEFRTQIEGSEEGLWSLGYGGRIRQLLKGCL